MSEKNTAITRYRGFGLSEYPASISVILMHAAIQDVAPVVAAELQGNIVHGQVVRNIYGIPTDVNGAPVFQFKGHSWTICLLARTCQEKFSKKLSTRLRTACICFEYEEASGWQGYSLIEQGEVSEHYMFGPDYRAEMAEWVGETQEEIQEPTDHGIPWDLNLTDGECQYLFRSTRRSVSGTEVQEPQRFLHAFFVEQDAWLPNREYLPTVENDGICRALALEKTDFEEVDIIQFKHME